MNQTDGLSDTIFLLSIVSVLCRETLIVSADRFSSAWEQK